MTRWPSSLAVVALVALSIAGRATPASAATTDCAQSASAKAGIVVQHQDGSRRVGCVAFGESSVSGFTLLQRSGIAFESVYYPSVGGDAICSIEGEPTSPAGGWNTSNCLGSPYWGVYKAAHGGPWYTTGGGVDAVSIGDGDGLGLSFARSGNSPPGAGNPAPAPHPAPAATGTGAGDGSGNAPPGSGTGRAGPGSPSATPTATGSPSPAPSASAAPSADPGELALGGAEAAPPPGNPGTGPPTPAGSPAALGIATAALVALGLAVVLLGQLLLPRLRR